MAKVRFSHLDDFVLKDDGRVGIGTSLPSSKVEVIGTVRAANIKSSSGITTIVSLDGYVNQEIKYGDNVTVDSGEGATLSGEVVVGAGLTLTVGTGVTSGQGSIERLKVSNTFTPPIGGINERPSAPQPGALFYNKDFKTIEYWDGNFWRQVDNTTRRGRGLFAGGRTPTFPASIGYIEIATLGNAVYFGDLTVARESATNNVASSTRGLFAGGYHPGGADDEIDYVTMASEGNAIDFGNLSTEIYSPGGGSSSTRGIFGGGHPAVTDIEYVEINTLGDVVDFGDLVTGRRYPSGVASPIRACFAGGTNASSPYPPFNIIDYITIASKGNAVRFGELTTAVQMAVGGCSNSTRGLYHLGTNSWSPTWNSVNQVDYITLASEGNATNFGELTVARSDISSSGNSTRGVLSGGYNPAASDVIDYVTIATTANAIDFGNLTQARGTSVGCVSSPTRGISGWGGFTGSNVNTIDYITIATTGNATDFGDTVGTNSRNTGHGSSPTRGVRGGGYTSTSVNQIDYLTIATTGNSVDFGDLTQIRYGNGGVSSNTRCIWGGGYTYSPNAHTNTMDYVTIATTGNATDFGDLISVRTGTSALGNSIRGVWFGGYSPTWVNIIDYVTIATAGNANDFGDGINTVRNAGAISDSHGGLS